MWLIVSSTVGWTLALLSVTFLLAIPFYLIQPLLVGVTKNAFDTDYGIFHVERVQDAFLQYVLVVPAFLLWWFGSPLLMRLVARLDRALLGPPATPACACWKTASRRWPRHAPRPSTSPPPSCAG